MPVLTDRAFKLPSSAFVKSSFDCDNAFLSLGFKHPGASSVAFNTPVSVSETCVMFTDYAFALSFLA